MKTKTTDYTDYYAPMPEGSMHPYIIKATNEFENTLRLQCESGFQPEVFISG